MYITKTLGNGLGLKIKLQGTHIAKKGKAIK